MEDYTDLMIPGKLIHFVEVRPFAGHCPGAVVSAEVPPSITERVVRVREVFPDGLGFVGDCLREARAGREFLFSWIADAREWDGKAITDFHGRDVIPAFWQVIECIRAKDPAKAERLAARMAAVAS
jgi:hypothetical protein